VNKYRITTPELVAFHYAIAGLSTRCLAWLLDEVFIISGYAAIIFASLWLGGLGTFWVLAAIILGMFILDFSYFVFFELYWQGQSPGKRRFHIRVISAQGSKLRFNDVLIRNLMRPLDLLPFGMVVGGSVACIDKWHRRLGDMVADTIVVRDVRQELPQALANEKTRVNSFRTDPALRNRILTRITRPQRDLIMDLALRRDQIDPAVREQLFAQAASHFRSGLALPSDLDHLSDEQTVVNLALLIQEERFTA
jgi:uncharacterized RDD family membrane protein YckC